MSPYIVLKLIFAIAVMGVAVTHAPETTMVLMAALVLAWAILALVVLGQTALARLESQESPEASPASPVAQSPDTAMGTATTTTVALPAKGKEKGKGSDDTRVP